jgi:hypothetical protein
VAEIPDTWMQIMWVLVRGSVAWQTPTALAAAIGWNIEPTMDVLAMLDDAGWIEVWDKDEEPTITLSPLGAERLGVRLVEIGAALTPRWIDIGDPDPRPPAAKRVCGTARAAALHYVIDPHPSPLAVAEKAEDLVRHNKLRLPYQRARFWFEHDAPWPTTLLGLGLTQWPGPGRDPDEECPACGNLALKPSMYCLCCDRWGLDGIFPTVMAPRKPGRPRREQPLEVVAERETHECAAARDRRRAHRRARRRAQKLAEELRKSRTGSPRNDVGAPTDCGTIAGIPPTQSATSPESERG